MLTCSHKCSECGRMWDCLFPHYSNCASIDEAYERGWRGCNSWCPVCQEEKRNDHNDRVSSYESSNDSDTNEKK